MPRTPARRPFGTAVALTLLMPLAGLSTAPAAQAAAQTGVRNQLTPINIIASHSGRCVEVAGSVVVAGTTVAQKDCTGQAGAVWALQESAAGGGSVNIVNPNSGKCVEVQPPDPGGFEFAKLGACSAAGAVSFRMEDRGSHAWLKPLSSPAKCLEVSSGSHVNGTFLRLAPCNGQSGTAFHQRPTRSGNDAPREPHKGMERVNLTSTGDQISVGIDTGQADGGGISTDSRFVTFATSANSLVPDDTNTHRDVFVRDRHEGTIERVSVSTTRAQGDGASHAPSISADGRFVVFESDASNLVAGDTNNAMDVFLRDRQTGVTERLSVSTAGGQANQPAQWPSISPDGRFITFQSAASNLVAGDTNNAMDVFLRDRQTGTTERVSVSDTEVQGNLESTEGMVTANGRYVTFSSPASNLVTGDANNGRDVFLRDRQLGTTKRISAPASIVSTAMGSHMPNISSDGSFVVFTSDAAVLPNDTTIGHDIFAWNRRTGVTTLVSVSNEGVAGTKLSLFPSISDDGRYVAFDSFSPNLVPGDTNGKPDIFVRDLLHQTTVRVSVSDVGVQSNDSSSIPKITADGSYVVFQSYATNLIVGDTNNAPDLFVQARPQDMTFAGKGSGSAKAKGAGKAQGRAKAQGGTTAAGAATAQAQGEARAKATADR